MELPPENETIFFPDIGCFGCSQQINDSGLKLTFKRSGEKIIIDHSIPSKFCGYPGTVHGGIVATIFDEICCAAVIFLKGRQVVTGELNVRYKKTCPTDVPVVFSATISDDSHPKYAVVKGELFRDDTLLSSAESKVFYVNDSVFQVWQTA